MSGLATDRKIQEYLSAGESEEEALTTLFTAIPATEAKDIYLSCIADILKYTESCGEEKKDPVLGTWSRLVLLGWRITDKESFQDVDENMRRAVVSSVTGTLCSPACLKDPCTISTVICLVRRIFIPRFFGDEEHVTSLIERYEVWLRDLTSNSNADVIRPLLEPLVQLIPLEPLHYLKLHQKLFSRNRMLFHISSDYVAKLRCRIRDFDPNYNKASRESNVKQNIDSNDSDENFDKTVNEVVEFVSNFKETGSLPNLIVRRMNFHRYHFRKVTLPILLHPDFATLKLRENGRCIPMDLDVFDEYRIRMIQEIAFNRKDHAIKVAEAKSAIDIISTAKRARGSRIASKESVSTKVDFASASIGKTSSIADTFSAIVLDTISCGADKDMLIQESKIEKAKELLCDNVSTSILQCSDNEEISSIAINVLEGLCTSLETVLNSQSSKGRGDLVKLCTFPFSENGVCIVEECKLWWRKSGLPFLYLVDYFFCDPRILRLQKLLCYQIIALLCLRIDSLPEKRLLCLSVVLVSLVILRTKIALQNLCFLRTSLPSSRYCHICEVVLECLPVSKPELVIASAKLSLYFAFLLTAFPEDGLLSLNLECDSMNVSMDYTKRYCVTSEFAKLPAALLRWVLASPWRLTETDKGNKSFELSNYLTTETSALCHKAACFLSEFQYSEGETNALIAMLNVEIRAGWGYRSAIASQLRALLSAGHSCPSILNASLRFLASMKKSHRNNLDWVLQGILLFYEESTGNHSISRDDCAAVSISRCLEEDKLVAYSMMEYYRMLDWSYFEGCDEMTEHISQSLVLKMWPLPRRTAAYILRCMSNRDVISTDVSPFFIANCSIGAVVEREFNTIPITERLKSGTLSVHNLVKEVATELRIMTHRQSMIQDSTYNSTNGVVNSQSTRSHVTTISLSCAHALGIALSMKLITERHQNVDSVEVMHNIVTDMVSRTGRPGCSDVLDGATVATALLQSREHFSDYSEVDEEWQESCLTMFVRERINLCEGDVTMIPFWVVRKVPDEFDTCSGDGRALLKEWVMFAQCDNVRREAWGCIARLLGSLDSAEGVVEHVAEMLGPHKAATTFLNNLAWGFVQTNSMPDKSRTRVRQRLISVIGRIGLYLRPTVDGDFVAGVMHRFGTVGDEILVLLKAKGFR